MMEMDKIVTEADALAANAATLGDHTALIFDAEKTSYRLLDMRASQIANGLRRLGLPYHGRVAILARNSATYFELLFGIIRADMTTLPLNWRLAAPEIIYILQDAQVECLFYDEDFAEVVAQARAQCPTLRHCISIDGKGEDGLPAWRDRQSSDRPVSQSEPEDIMIQFYTSGTTGHPKGVQISHRSSRVMREMEVAMGGEWLNWTHQDVAIVALPNFHLSGTSWALQWLARGATCVIQPQVDAGAFLKAIQDHGVTQIMAIPTVVQMMLDHPLFPSIDTSSLRNVFYGGMTMPAPRLRRARAALGCNFIQIYGMTENNGSTCYLTPADHAEGSEELLKSCGRPLPPIEMKIMNADGEEMATGEIGEVCIKSPSLMSGYWNRDDIAQETHHGDFYRTGDAGYRDENGYLFLVDRTKDMIVSGGENVYPAEIERVLVEHPGVVELSVIGVPDDRWGEAVKAVVVRGDDNLTGDELIAFARGKIAGYKVPKSVDFVDALPRNANGKILKRELRDRYRNRADMS
ncbi:long-chain-fatty-acid--CoA ligase [Sphingobium sp. JS3065]|uniref:long-chain-fatty-acid--CoA ligase n=1 Tax=Sphingobium sp. JS3065 TaxID=2970925 RepID=UPI0022645C77|nr:long-chain-fatty-acid--CoA ligase [Sphingobium sp. JS3065]UZW57064.1 long-chain-fatty-acid--CoA ligase [Sphingobium sp. JS3065]